MTVRSDADLKTVINRDVPTNVTREVSAMDLRNGFIDLIDSKLNVDQRLFHLSSNDAFNIADGGATVRTFNVPAWLRDRSDQNVFYIHVVGAMAEGTVSKNPLQVSVTLDAEATIVGTRTVSFNAEETGRLTLRVAIAPAVQQVHARIFAASAAFVGTKIDVAMLPSFAFDELNTSTQRLYYARSDDTPDGLPFELATVTDSNLDGDPSAYDAQSIGISGVTWYRSVDQAVGDGQLWAVHVTTQTWLDGTQRVFFGPPAKYRVDLDGAIQYTGDQELTTDQQNTAQRNMGGPFVVNQPGGSRAAEDPFAQWAATERIFFLTGTSLASEFVNEVPSGARLGINTRAGAAIQFPLFLNGQLAFGNSRSFVADLIDTPDRFCLVIRLFFVADTEASQIICDGLIRLQRSGETVTVHGDNAQGGETSAEVGDLALATTGTITVEGYKQDNDEYVLYADANFRSSAIPAQVGLNASPPSHVSFGIREHKDAIADGEHDSAMFAWDILIFEPDRGNAPNLTEEVRDTYFAHADRESPYGIVQRESINFGDTGFPHGSVYTESASGLNVEQGETIEDEFKIPITNLHGDEAHRVRVTVDSVAPAAVEASNLTLLFRIGNNEYVFGRVGDDGTFALRAAHADDGTLRVRIRNDDATELTGIRVNAQGFDRVIPTVDGVPEHSHDAGDQLEFYQPIEDAIGLAQDMVVNFSRSIPVADIREIRLWGKPGHGSLTEQILYPSKNLVVTPLNQSPAAGQVGDVYVAGWSVNDQIMMVTDHGGAAAPSGVPYSVFRFVRSSTADPAGFVSGIKVVGVSGSQRNLRAIEMVLDA